MWLAALVVMLAATVLSACGTDPHQAVARQNKTRLDTELQHARADLGIPDAMLQPIEKQEQKIADGEGGWRYNYQDAASNYALLYTQLTGVEQTAGETLKQQATADLQAFTAALQVLQSQGFVEAASYQDRLSKAEQDFSTAKVPGDYVRLDTTVRAQTAALRALGPAYKKLSEFQSIVTTLQTNGVSTSLANTWYQQDLQVFREAASAERYVALQEVIDGQILQMMADQSEALPYIVSSLLAQYQTYITTIKQSGQDTSAYQKQYDQDAHALLAAHKLSEYLALVQTINQQTSATAVSYQRAIAYNDLQDLRQALTLQQQTKLNDPFDASYNGVYGSAYEYADAPTNGIADVTNTFNQAQTVEDYQSVDTLIKDLRLCLRALHDDMSDHTAPGVAHQSDLFLLSKISHTDRVMMVSLYEQVARFYENGVVVGWTYVTTGRPELPSPPGVHTALYKVSPTVFTSPEPKTSPFWYAPTPINYAVLYADYGFFVHDGWWRSEFGPGTNLPHIDPAAFDGGSHGCINLPLADMRVWYPWLPVGATIIDY